MPSDVTSKERKRPSDVIDRGDEGVRVMIISYHRFKNSFNRLVKKLVPNQQNWELVHQEL